MKLLIGGAPTGTLKHVSEDFYAGYLGMLTSWADGAFPDAALRLGAEWAMDNFAFTAFDPIKFVDFLDKLRHRPSPLWVASPDVVMDAPQTLKRFTFWHEIIRARGYKVALVAQNGLENEPIEWDKLDALFIGGDDGWKLGRSAYELVRAAKARGKLVHFGRVNSNERLRYAMSLGCDSADGSSYASVRSKIKDVVYDLQYHVPNPTVMHTVALPFNVVSDAPPKMKPIRLPTRKQQVKSLNLSLWEKVA